MMNLGYTLQINEFRYFRQFNDQLPVGHKIIGERPSLHPLCTEILIEGPSMPIWEEGQEVSYVAVDVISELLQGDCMHVTVAWCHKPLAVWQRVIPARDYAQWVSNWERMLPEIRAVYNRS